MFRISQNYRIILRFWISQIQSTDCDEQIRCQFHHLSISASEVTKVPQRTSHNRSWSCCSWMPRSWKGCKTLNLVPAKRNLRTNPCLQFILSLRSSPYFHSFTSKAYFIIGLCEETTDWCLRYTLSIPNKTKLRQTLQIHVIMTAHYMLG